MKRQPLVSVIIPFYNRFDLLDKTLLSVRAQNYVNYEVILIDDCSELKWDIDYYKNIFSGITVIYERLKKNSGPGMARSKARELASGVYITYLDSDDLWESNFLSSTIEKLEIVPSVSMVFTNVLIKNGNRKIKRLSIDEGICNFYDLVLNKKIYWATGAAVWRSSVSLNANWMSIRDHEDYVHDILSLMYNPKIFHISEMLCIVNKNSQLGIKRSNIEMLKGLNILLKSNVLYRHLKKDGLTTNFLNFVLLRISKRKYQFKDYFTVFKTYFNSLRWSDNYLITSIQYIRRII